MEDDGESELLFVGTQGADAVAKMLRKHRDNAVHKVYGSGSLLSLAVYYGVGLHIVGDIRDMDTDFIMTIWEHAERERIVEVLRIDWVDCESQHVAHVKTLRDDFFSDSGIDFVGCFLDCRRIFVRQTEFSKNSMNLGIVFTATTKDVDYLAARILAILLPLDDFHHSLVSGLTTFELGLGDENIG